jgi:hypothetical protein
VGLNFKNLQQLNLCTYSIKSESNQIERIEALADVTFTDLKEVLLGDNMIENIEPLEKCFFPGLRYLNLCNDFIIQIKTKSRTLNHSIKLTSLNCAVCR